MFFFPSTFLPSHIFFSPPLGDSARRSSSLSPPPFFLLSVVQIILYLCVMYTEWHTHTHTHPSFQLSFILGPLQINLLRQKLTSSTVVVTPLFIRYMCMSERGTFIFQRGLKKKAVFTPSQQHWVTFISFIYSKKKFLKNPQQHWVTFQILCYVFQKKNHLKYGGRKKMGFSLSPPHFFLPDPNVCFFCFCFFDNLSSAGCFKQPRYASLL